MTISNKAMNILAQAITPKAVKTIFESEEWVDLCMEQLPSIITKELGECDDELMVELACNIMDRMFIKSV